MKYQEYYITNQDGSSNCVIRSMCKALNKEYVDVYNEMLNVANEINKNINDIEVFELYMKNNNIFKIEGIQDIKVKDLKVDNGCYVVFCWDEKDYYHMVAIIDNVLYDRSSESLELNVISIYKSTLSSNSI